MAYTNPEDARAYQRTYYLAHRAEKIARAKAWKATHPEEARLSARQTAARRRLADPEHLRELQRAWYKRHPNAKSVDNRAHRLRSYGLTLAEYDSMLERQDGLCACCRRAETHRGRNGGITRMAVDHDHVTGSVRGLLCHSCNTGIGSFYDDPELLIAASEYIKRWRQ